MDKYDSTFDTRHHIDVVRENITEIIQYLYMRAIDHDSSKLLEPEKSGYDQLKPVISETEKKYGYGSPEYEQVVKDFKEILGVHFRYNRHHPEHFENGINGMTLIDLVEMLSDWKAVSSRSGQPLNFEANQKRFGISEQLLQILQNTAKELRW